MNVLTNVMPGVRVGWRAGTGRRAGQRSSDVGEPRGGGRWDTAVSRCTADPDTRGSPHFGNRCPGPSPCTRAAFPAAFLSPKGGTPRSKARSSGSHFHLCGSTHTGLWAKLRPQLSCQLGPCSARFSSGTHTSRTHAHPQGREI